MTQYPSVNEAIYAIRQRILDSVLIKNYKIVLKKETNGHGETAYHVWFKVLK